MRNLILWSSLAALVAASSPALDAQTRGAREVTIPAGTQLRLELAEAVGSDTSRLEDRVSARVQAPVVIRGITAIPSGARLDGVVIEADRSARVKGRARLGLQFHALTLPRDGERYAIRTRPWVKEARGTKKKDALTIAVPAAGGSLIGALVGGRKGAAVGAVAGGGAGTGLVLATRGEEVRLGRGHVILVRLARPVTVHSGW